MSLCALIPARSGSRRLPGKNLADLAGEPLLLRKIRQLQSVPRVDEIVVSSDSPDYLDMARAVGAKTQLRPPAYCDEKTQPFGAVVAWIAQRLETDHVLWATCTSPLVEPHTYTQALGIYRKALAMGFDSLISVEFLQRYLWDDNGPINYALGLGHVPSQELPRLYRVTDGIIVAPRVAMVDWSYFHGPKPYRMAISKREAIDVDDLLDLQCAAAWL